MVFFISEGRQEGKGAAVTHLSPNTAINQTQEAHLKQVAAQVGTLSDLLKFIHLCVSVGFELLQS